MYSPTMSDVSPNDRHRVYLSFQDRHGWQCQFLEADLKTPLPKRLHFTSPELVEKEGGFPDQESRLMVEHGVSMGREGVFLILTEEQYAKLKRSVGTQSS